MPQSCCVLTIYRELTLSCYRWNSILVPSSSSATALAGLFANNPLTSRQHLENAISRIPAELETSYMPSLPVITPSCEDLAARMLRLVLGGSKPLSLDEFSIALTIRPNHRTAENIASKCQIGMLVSAIRTVTTQDCALAIATA